MTTSLRRRFGMVSVTVVVMAMTLTASVGATPGPSAAGHAVMWTPTEIPLPPNGVFFSQRGFSLACPAVGVCVAVWSYYDVNQNGFGIIETLSGGTWSQIEAPLPANASANPNVVLDTPVCPTVDSCVVVGSYTDSNGNPHGLIETLSGGTWTPTEAPLPANASLNPYIGLHAVACPQVNTCIAVGGYVDANGNNQILIETLATGTWTASEGELPANAATTNERAYITQVVCPDAGGCVTTGNYTDSANNQHLVSESLSNGTWTATEIPFHLGARETLQQVYISGLACPAVGSCVAVGAFTIGNPGRYGDGPGIIDTLSQGVWTTRDAPIPNLPPDKWGSQLSDVACSGVGACVAVGNYNNPQLIGGPGLIDTLSSGKWTASTVPPPVRSDSYLGSVACPATGSCVATGFYVVIKEVTGGFTEQFEGVMEVQVGKKWVRTNAPLPADAAFDPQLFNLPVVCPAVGACETVAVYRNTNANINENIGALVESLSGGPASPLITSAPKASFVVGHAGSFTVMATGAPLPKIVEPYKLPNGLQFTEGAGTATISGTPAAGTAGRYLITVTASNGVPPAASQLVTLIIRR